LSSLASPLSSRLCVTAGEKKKEKKQKAVICCFHYPSFQLLRIHRTLFVLLAT
jgi:hypothetical protein